MTKYIQNKCSCSVGCKVKQGQKEKEWKIEKIEVSKDFFFTLAHQRQTEPLNAR